MLLKMQGMLGLREKKWSRMERFHFLKKLEIPLHRKYDVKLQRDGIFVQYYQVQLAIGLVCFIFGCGNLRLFHCVDTLAAAHAATWRVGTGTGHETDQVCQDCGASQNGLETRQEIVEFRGGSGPRG